MSGGTRTRDYRKLAAGIGLSAILLAGLAAGSHWQRAAKAAGTSPPGATKVAQHPLFGAAALPDPLFLSHGGAATKQVGASGAGPGPNAVRPYLPLAISTLLKPTLAPEPAAAALRHAGAAASPANQLVANYGKLPLRFEANQGQTDSRVKFLSRGKGYSLFLTGDEAVLTLESASQKAKGKGQEAKVEASVAPTLRSAPDNASRGDASRAGLKPGATTATTTDSVLRMKLVGANASATVAGAEELPSKSNYFIGNDSKKWRTNVPNYAQVKYAGVYPGVDLVYYGNQGGQLEYDFVVAPGADPSAIALDVGAVREPPTVAAVSDRRSAVGTPPLQKRAHRDAPLQIAANGDLVVKTDGGEVRFHKPLVYQEQSVADSLQLRVRDEIRNSKIETRSMDNHQSPIANRKFLDGHYNLDAQNHVRFQVAPYDHSKPLFIDPVLSYSTYLGGSAYDYAYGIAVDSSGNAYVTGTTNSANFATHPVQTPCTEDCPVQTVFVTKFNAAGSALLYSTYFGGIEGNAQIGNGIAVDSSGDAYVVGVTNSTNFPTVNPIQGANPNGATVAFVAELNAAGSALVYSTYLGGTSIGGTYGYGIAVDSSANAYVTGYTNTTSFPTTTHAFQTTFAGSEAVFVAKLNFSATPSPALTLVYSTFLGGSRIGFGYGIAVDSSGHAYVTGATNSSDFPTTTNAFQPACVSCNGTDNYYDDAFVAELNPAGSALVYSTYLGGSSGDIGYAIAVDSSGNAYVTGSTNSTDFPLANSYQNTCYACAHGNSTAFVAELNGAGASPAGSYLVYSTYLGGSYFEEGQGIAVDSSGNAYVTGTTDSTDFPTKNPIQATCDTCAAGNAFVTELNFPGSNAALVYSTYLGGSNYNYGQGIAVDSSGNAYVTGATLSTDFPTTTNAFQTTYGGAGDAFVAKISLGPAASFSPVSLTFAPQSIGVASAPQTVTVTNTGSANLVISTVTIGGADPGDFATSADLCSGATLTTSGASSMCTINVTFKPTATGTRSASLSFPDNAPASPQTVSLTGGGPVPVASVSPPSLTFASQSVGTTSASQPVSLSDEEGGASLLITSIAVSANFGETNNCGSSVSPVGLGCTISVTFKPTATGTLTGTLTITDNNNGVAGSTQTVNLSGTGASAASLVSIAVTPAELSLAVGGTLQFTATGTFSDGSTQNLTSTATWSSSATGVATISTAGLASAVAAGQTTIEAASGSINGSTTLTVATGASFALTGILNTGRFYHTATLLTNGLVLIAGGEDINGNPSTSAELYNPSTGTFTATGSLNTGRQYHTATLLNNGMVLIAGGFGPLAAGGYGDLASAELYNPATGMFSYTTNLSTGATTSLNYARAQHTATVLDNGMVLLAGGNSSAFSQVASAELYNPATGIFTPTASLNANRYAHTATLLNNGMVLLAGGFNYSSDVLTSAELYNPANGSFAYTTGGLKTGRYYHTATLLNNGTVLIAAGSGFGVTLASAELYNPSTGIFVYTTNGSGTQTTLSAAREYDTATLLNNGMVLLAGGYEISGGIHLASAELYDPVAGTFTLTGPMNNARFDHTATLLTNGMVLVAGGIDGGTYISAELYEPATLTPPNLESIALSPSSPTVAAGAAQNFTATGTFSGSSTQQLASVTWSSSNTAVASITDDATNLGAAYGLAGGTTTVSACAGAICGSTTLTVTGGTPVAGVSPTTLMFGHQLVGTTSASQPVTLSNTGTVTLTIPSIVPSANFGVTSGSNACRSSVAAGSSCMIYVTFSPSLTATGAQTGTLTVTDNSGGVTGSTQTVNLSGAGVAPVVTLSPSPASLTFSSQAKGTTSASQPVNVYNTGSATLNITGIAASSNFGETDNCSVSGGGVITSGGYCTINVTFSPSLTATVGPLTGALTITDNNNGVTGSTQTVSLSGTATSPSSSPAMITDNETITVMDTVTFSDVLDSEAVTVADTVFVTPLINVGAGVAFISAGSVGFGSVAAGQMGTQIVTLSNIGESPLTLTSATISAGSAFTISQIVCSNGAASLPTTLPAGGACNVTVSYTAPSQGSPTPTATITFTDSAVLSNLTSTPAGSSFTQSLSLSGTGTTTPAPPAPSATVTVPTDNETITVADTVTVTTVPLIGGTLSSNSLTFANQAVSTTSAKQSVTLTSSGTTSLTITSITASGDFALLSTATSCSLVTGSGGPLLPGETCTIDVAFTPTAVGTRTGLVTITDNNNGVAGSTQTIGLTGTGIANTPAGTNVTASVPPSPGAPPTTVTFSNVTTPGNTTVAASTACSTSAPANFSVGTGAGAVCVDVSTTAVFSGFIYITVSFNPANYPNPPGPQIFHLVGGVWVNVTVPGSVNYTNDTITAQVTSLSPFGIFMGMPAVSLEASQGFGSVVLNAPSSAQQVTLTNNGGANVVISTAAVSGTNASDFTKSADTCSGATVPPNGTCSVTVTFKPTAGGTRTATLTIADNAATSPQAVALSGTGEDFSLVAAGSSTSATVAPGQSTAYNLSLGNLGGYNQSVAFTCTGAPSEAICEISPNPLTPGSSATNVTITILTTAPAAGAPRSRPLPPVPPLSSGLRAVLMLALALAAVAWAVARRNQPGRSRWQSAIVPLTAGVLLILALAGCHSPAINPGTPAGTYPLTVTGTAGSGSSTLSHSVTLTLIVS